MGNVVCEIWATSVLKEVQISLLHCFKVLIILNRGDQTRLLQRKGGGGVDEMRVTLHLFVCQ